jgi:hypothetical protein
MITYIPSYAYLLVFKMVLLYNIYVFGIGHSRTSDIRVI